MKKRLQFLSVVLALATLSAYGQTVKGRVTASQDNSSLPGVSVVLKGTSVGTTTDSDGNYSIAVGANENAVLSFSFIGFTTQEVSIGGRTTIDVVLQEDAMQLSEVIVTAFGEKKEVGKIAYAVQEVKGGDLTRANNANVINSLQGKVAGVHIDQGTGGPMSSSRIRIRGNSSLSNNTQPLFVVDGVLIRPTVTGADSWGAAQDFGNIMKNINPDNIESMTVLKGSAASSLYGSDALNGVIIITTKKGYARPGLGVTYSHTSSFDKAYKFIDVQNEFGGGNAATFATGADGVEEVDPSLYYYSYGPKLDGRMVRDVDQRMIKWEANDPLSLFQTGKFINNNIVIEGGSENTTFRASYSHLDNSSVMPGGTEMVRNNFNVNASQKIGKMFDIGVNVDYTNNAMVNPIRQGGNFNPVFALVYFQPRHFDINYWKNNYKDPVNGGRLPDASDPYAITGFLWDTFEDRSERTENIFRGNIDITTHVRPWLNLIVRANLQNELYKSERKRLGEDPRFSGGTYSQGESFNSQYRIQSLLTANKQLNQDLFLSATIGGETNKVNGGRSYSLETRGGLRLPAVYSITNGVNGINTTTSLNPSRLKNAFYIYGDLTYKEMLTLTLSHRTDFSSTLAYADGSGDWSYSYPSAGLAWTFTESFSSVPNWISFGKLRANFGVTGGDTDPWTINTTGAYKKADSEYLSPNGLVNYYSFVDNTLFNRKLKNKEAREWEIGTDLQFFENRIGLDVAYYNKISRNEIFKLAAAPESGVNDMIINGGKIQNKGIEIVLRATPIKSAGLQWNTVFNFTRNKNKVLELASGVEQFELGLAFGADVKSLAKPGLDYATIVTNYAYATYEAKDSEGNLIDHPNNGKRVIGSNPNANALTYLRSADYGQGQKEIGTAMERFLLSNINTVTYKNFSLNLQVDAKVGGMMVSATHQYGTTNGSLSNTLFGRDLEHGGVQYTTANGEVRTDGIIPDGVLANGIKSIKDGSDLGGISYQEAVDGGHLLPIEARRYYRNISNWGAGIREYSAFENSWVSLREVSLAYNVPASFISKVKLQSLRLSVTGRNLAYLYRSLPINLNPEGLKSNASGEFSEYGGLPMIRQMGFSVTAGF